jgi:hypothetical protein
MVVVALREPEVPVMVIVEVPAAAVPLAVRVSTLVLVVGLVAKDAVTPAGNPEAARVTEPVNGLTSVTVIVSVPLAPCAVERVAADGFSVKLPVPQVVEAVSMRAIVVVALREPDVPVIVIVFVATTAEQLAVRVRTLVEVAGLGANEAVTPAGSPEAARVTLPLNGITSVTVMVSVPLAPWAIDRVVADGLIVKLPAVVTVRAMVVVAVKEPEVPVMVTVAAPVVAVLLAVRVSTLVEVVGLVANAAVTPAGSPEAARVTLPLNGLTSVIVIVSVVLAPGAIDRAAAEGLSVKLPVPAETGGVPVPMTMPRPLVPI